MLTLLVCRAAHPRAPRPPPRRPNYSSALPQLLASRRPSQRSTHKLCPELLLLFSPSGPSRREHGGRDWRAHDRRIGELRAPTGIGDLHATAKAASSRGKVVSAQGKAARLCSPPARACFSSSLLRSLAWPLAHGARRPRFGPGGIAQAAATLSLPVRSTSGDDLWSSSWRCRLDPGGKVSSST